MWQALLGGTDTPLVGNFTMLVNDLDTGGGQTGPDATRFERISVTRDSLDSYTLDEFTDIRVSEEGEFVQFTPMDADPGLPGVTPGNTVQLTFSNTSNFIIEYDRRAAGANIGLDGNFTGSFFDNGQTTDVNADFAATYVDKGDPAPIAAEDITITDDGLITEAVISITNTQVGDQLNVVAALPSGITIDSNSTSTSLILTGSASPQNYEAAIKAIGFEVGINTPAPDTSIIRLLDISVTDDEGIESNVARTSIQIIDDDTSETVPGDAPLPGLLAPPALTPDDGSFDTDGDGVSDDADIDDDNDGILDSVEEQIFSVADFTVTNQTGNDSSGTFEFDNSGFRIVFL